MKRLKKSAAFSFTCFKPHFMQVPLIKAKHLDFSPGHHSCRSNHLVDGGHFSKIAWWSQGSQAFCLSGGIALDDVNLAADSEYHMAASFYFSIS
jgi:hypothetical protein